MNKRKPQALPIESDLKKAVYNKLRLMETFNIIDWFERLNSGKVITDKGGYIQLCRIGTPDFCVYVNGKLIFLELKRKKKNNKKNEEKDLRYNQREFFVKMVRKGIGCFIVDDVNQLTGIINSV